MGLYIQDTIYDWYIKYLQVHVRVNSSSPPRRNVSQNTETKVSPRKNSKNQKKKGASNSAAAEVSNNRGFVD